MLEALDLALEEGNITPSLFETYLATIRHLQPAFVSGNSNASLMSSKELPRELPKNFILELIQKERISDELRAAALTHLDQAEDHLELLLALFEKSEGPLKNSLIEVLKRIDEPSVSDILLGLLLDQSQESWLHARALVALGYQSRSHCSEIESIIAMDNSEAMTSLARRYLLRCGEGDKLPTSLKDIPSEQTSEAWLTAVTDNGDPYIGEHLFLSRWASCQSCHRVEGWGGTFGPDLSHVGSSKSKAQLVRAIVEPDKEISPEWQGWFVTSSDGQVHIGRQIDVGFDSVKLMLEDGEFVSFAKPKDYGILQHSLMPTGLQTQFTSEEFDHLIGYLYSLK